MYYFSLYRSILVEGITALSSLTIQMTNPMTIYNVYVKTRELYNFGQSNFFYYLRRTAGTDRFLNAICVS